MLIKRLLITLTVLICLTGLSIKSYAFDVSAKSAALIEVNSGKLIFGKNENEKMSMASTTKIMTALLAIEAGEPNKLITVTNDMVHVEGTSIGLLAGDKITLKTLIYGMLLESGNDAANATAITVGGNVDNFVKMMNNRAQQIGMNNTHFVTPSGLDSKEHYSTAYDMALLGTEAIKNPEFRAISSTISIKACYGNPPYQRSMVNHNRLLRSYDGSIGIKTGFTKKSGRCLVSAAERNGIILVAVTLNDRDDWDDHKSMFDYGFSQYKNVELDSNVSDLSVKVVGGSESKVSVKCATTPTMAINNTETANTRREIYLEPFVYAPIEEGKIIGTVKYYSGDKLVCEVPLASTSAVKSTSKVKEVKNKGKKSFWDWK